MKVTFQTEKRFPDGSIEILLKNGYALSEKTRAKIAVSKFWNALERESKREKLLKEWNECTLLEQYHRKRRIIELELSSGDIQSVRRSARRARQTLYDICKCNDFQFFVTFTYSPDVLDRLDDVLVKRKFTQWANDIKKRFPTMYYIAVPEYHKLGGLHFHLLIGGISFEDLKPSPSVTKRGRLKIVNGKQVYNVGAWRYGFSEMSIIENVEAAKHYICKYISKQHFDQRFHGKRRYYCSYNITRPEIIKSKVFEGEPWALDLDVWQVKYLDQKKQYGVFFLNADGVVDKDYNTEETRRRVLPFVRSGAAGASEAPPRRCPDLTIGTLDRNEAKEADRLIFLEAKKEIDRQVLERSLLKVSDEDKKYLDSIGL